jgi:hypothetical protein
MRLRPQLFSALAAVLLACSREAPPQGVSAPGAGPTPAVRAVDAIARGALESLSPASREAVRRAPLPVLLLSDPVSAAATVVTAGARWYALSARVGERTLSLHATAEEPSEDGAPPVGHGERARGRPAMVLYNEGVRSVTWSEGGATYALEVECFRPFEDPACTRSDFVLGLAESLVRAPAEGAPSAPASPTRSSAPSIGGGR